MDGYAHPDCAVFKLRIRKNEYIHKQNNMDESQTQKNWGQKEQALENCIVWVTIFL